MAIVINAEGLICPQPVLKLATQAPQIPAGEILEIVGDCPTFERDITSWCERMKKTILEIKNEGNNVIRIKIHF